MAGVKLEQMEQIVSQVKEEPLCVKVKEEDEDKTWFSVPVKEEEPDLGAESDSSWDWEPPASQTLRGKILSRLQLNSDQSLESVATGKAEGEEFALRRRDRPFSCSDCGKHYSKKSHLQRHKLVHSGQKPFGCSQCTSRFLTQAQLSAHMHVHSIRRSFSCSACGKGFSVQAQLQRHMFVHEANRPFRCSACGRSFRMRVDLRRHMRVHAEARPHQCPSCPKSFRFDSNLTQHLKTLHLMCRVCEQSFRDREQLQEHFLSPQHQARLVQTCRQCGRTFTSHAALQRHTQVHSSWRNLTAGPSAPRPAGATSCST
ncbi:unnamed protein product [Knipowitschia caucasica]